MLKDSVFKERQATLVAFLRDHRDQKFRPAELKAKTDVPIKYVRRLLKGRSEVQITEEPLGQFTYQAKGEH